MMSVESLRKALCTLTEVANTKVSMASQAPWIFVLKFSFANRKLKFETILRLGRE
jgi:hypothetical protein